MFSKLPPWLEKIIQHLLLALFTYFLASALFNFMSHGGFLRLMFLILWIYIWIVQWMIYVVVERLHELEKETS